MKDNDKKHSNEDLEWIYQEVFSEAVQYMRDFDVQAVAATYMAIAMRLYKTHLDEKEYKAMISELLGFDPIAINSALVSAQNRHRLY